MQYRTTNHSDALSILGYGCMRFTRKGASIDMAKAEREIVEGIFLGINYFDTAWLYPGSETALGAILAKYEYREMVNIATKLPQFLVRKPSDFDRFFEEECKRLQTDHVDYYLMHMLPDTARWDALSALGAKEWIERKKADCRIRNIGFSFHGNSDVFCEILEAYPWDFCQIQYNYIDENSQGGVRGLHRAHELGMQVIVMEPLRGGKLATGLPKEALEAFAESGHGWSPAEWGLRWLWNQPEVTCVLSGMNSLEMLRENARVADEVRAGSFGPAEFETIERARQAIMSNTKAPCTECRYCMPCPKGVDIPAIFRAYNESASEGKMAARVNYMQSVAFRENPGYATQCIECGACEKKCPQGLPIVELLKEADGVLGPLPFKVARKVVGAFVG